MTSWPYKPTRGRASSMHKRLFPQGCQNKKNNKKQQGSWNTSSGLAQSNLKISTASAGNIEWISSCSLDGRKKKGAMSRCNVSAASLSLMQLQLDSTVEKARGS